MHASDAHNNNHSHNRNPVPLDVLLLYEDIFTCLRAWQVLDLLTRQMEKRDVPIRLGANVWRFENLTDPMLHERATKDSGEVDLMIVAAHGSQDLPLPVQAWLEEWVRLRHPEERALVISLASHAADSPLRFARQIAHGTPVRVFPHWAGASLDISGPAPWRLSMPEPRKPDPGSRNSSSL